MKLKVLLIENDGGHIDDTKELVISCLESYQIFDSEPIFVEKKQIEKEEGVEALSDLLDKEEYHLAIVDHQLNGKGDSWDALKVFSDYNIFGKTKVIVHTGQLAEVDAYRASSLGAFSFVIKGDAIQVQIDRAIKVIAGEIYSDMLGSFIDSDFQELLQDKLFIQALYAGCNVKKVILLSDLAGSTLFLGGIKKNNPDKIGQVLCELLGWQAEVIKDHGGTVDKYYGDEIRAYFGRDLKDPSAEKENEYCNKATEAARFITSNFPKKLHQLFDGINGLDVPANLTYPRIVLHYDQVLWAMYGSKDHQDLTIWTHNVALLNRILGRVRDVHPYGKRELNKINIDEAVGEVFLTESVQLRLSDANLFGIRKLDVDDDYDDIDKRAVLFGIKAANPGE